VDHLSKNFAFTNGFSLSRMLEVLNIFQIRGKWAGNVVARPVIVWLRPAKPDRGAAVIVSRCVRDAVVLAGVL